MTYTNTDVQYVEHPPNQLFIINKIETLSKFTIN